MALLDWKRPRNDRLIQALDTWLSWVPDIAVYTEYQPCRRIRVKWACQGTPGSPPCLHKQSCLWCHGAKLVR